MAVNFDTRGPNYTNTLKICKSEQANKCFHMPVQNLQVDSSKCSASLSTLEQQYEEQVSLGQ